MFGTKFLSWITIKGIFYFFKVNNKLIFHFAKYILPTTSTSMPKFKYENRKNINRMIFFYKGNKSKMDPKIRLQRKSLFIILKYPSYLHHNIVLF